MVPKKMQPVFWSRNITNLDLQTDKNYIIHQVLAYGSWQDLKWLLATYKKSDLIDVFIKRPTKDYAPAAFNFVKNFILKIPDHLDIGRYDRTTPRIIGQK